MTWLDEMRAGHENSTSRIETSIARLVDRIQAVETTLDARFHALDAKIDDRAARLEVKIAETKADLMKWSLVFWVGAVGAIAALAGVLRQ